MPNLGNDQKLPYDELKKANITAANLTVAGSQLKPGQNKIFEIAGTVRLVAKKADGTVVSVALA